MKGSIKRFFALMFSLAFFLTLFPNEIGINKVEAASDDMYNINNLIHYDLGEKDSSSGKISINSGTILVPEKEGTYPVLFVIHGAGGKVSNFDSAMAHILNNAVKNGYIDPMVVVLPDIPKTQDPGYSGLKDFEEYTTNGLCSRLVTAIKSGSIGDYITSGTWNSSVAGRIDGKAPMSIMGLSMGGSVALHVGCTMRDTFINIGACSPSPYFYHRLYDKNGMYINPRSFVKDPKEMIYSNDPKGHFWICRGKAESVDFVNSVSDTKSAFKQTDTYSKFIFFDDQDNPAFDSIYGGHGMKLFYVEMFSFLYYLKNEEEPSPEIIKQTCDNLTIQGTGKEGIKGVVTLSGKNKIGETLTAAVTGSNAKEFKYQWRRGKENISGATSASYKLTSADSGKKISCKVTDKNGNLTGFVSGYVYAGDGSGTVAPDYDFTLKTLSSEMTVDHKSSYKLSVEASGKNIENISYEWQYATAEAPNSWTKSDHTKNSPTLEIPSATRDILYRCVVKNGNVKKESNVIKVNVRPLVKSVTANVSNGRVEEGKEFTLSVTAEGQELKYQWLKSSDNKNWETLSGKTSATIKTIGGKAGSTTYYRCKVTSYSQTVSKDIAITSIAHTHSWDSGKITTAATCTKDGVKTYTCSICKQTKTEAVKALGHILTHHNNETYISTGNGIKEYWECSRCKKLFADQYANTEINASSLNSKIVGWHKENGKWYMYDVNGVKRTGWVKDGNYWYHLNALGEMEAGWILDRGYYYYLGTTGVMKTGWTKYRNKWYYLNPSTGAMRKNCWVQTGGNWYYLKSDGSMAVNEWVDGGKYHVDSNGVWDNK